MLKIKNSESIVLTDLSDEDMNKLVELTKKSFLEDAIPFQDEQYEENYIAELEERHQDDCIRINELTVSLNKIVDLYANLRKQMGLV